MQWTLHTCMLANITYELAHMHVTTHHQLSLRWGQLQRKHYEGWKQMYINSHAKHLKTMWWLLVIGAFQVNKNVLFHKMKICKDFFEGVDHGQTTLIFFGGWGKASIKLKLLVSIKWWWTAFLTVLAPFLKTWLKMCCISGP